MAGNVRAGLVGVCGALGGCSEYEVSKDVVPVLGTDTSAPETTSDTPPDTQTDPLPDTQTGTGDTGAEDGCFAPEFGYVSSPAARLVTTDGSEPIHVALALSDTAYQDTLTLDAPEALVLMDAWTATVGTELVVGPYPVGTELVFGIDVHNTSNHWQSGPSDRNADQVAHVAVTYEGGCSWLIGFEDLYGGGDLDYNDVVFRVTGLLVER